MGESWPRVRGLCNEVTMVLKVKNTLIVVKRISCAFDFTYCYGVFAPNTKYRAWVTPVNLT